MISSKKNSGSPEWMLSGCRCSRRKDEQGRTWCSMNTQTLRSNLMLLLTAIIWGLAFVAQRIGAAYVGPFTFNGIRFALGSLSLVPLILFLNGKSSSRESQGNLPDRGSLRVVVPAGLAAGLVLFAGASLQQVGLDYAGTTAGKAAFITGLYIVLVPILGILWKQYISPSAWLGAMVALVGLYFLSVRQGLAFSTGDLLELAGSFCWAGHILLIDHLTNQKVNVLKLACTQCAVCSVLSLATALVLETITPAGLREAAIPILYGGILSVGVAYTLQIFGQKHAQPAQASIIMSLETVVAALGGAIILHESLGARGIAGCSLMLAGMLLSQLGAFKLTERQGRAQAD
jgi:drug/metabolite transporter (DMT)-like permease